MIAVGFVLGGIYSVFIVPRLFNDTPEVWGLVQLLMYYAQIISLFVLFSQPSVIIKYYPEYRRTHREKELLGYSFAVTILLFVVFGVLWFLFGKHLYFEEDATLYRSYYLVLVPLMAGNVIFEMLGAYARIRQRTVLHFFLGNSLQKVVFFIALTLMFFLGLSLEVLIALLVAIFLLRPLIMWMDLYRAEMLPGLTLASFRGLDTRRILDYSVFGLFGGIAYILIMRVDSIMIGNLLGLDQLAYYSIPVFLISTLAIPEKALAQISLPVISSLHSADDFRGIETMYKKVSVNQFVLGSIIFLLIWVNISLLMEILGEKFGNTAWAFFFLGIGKLIDLLTSANGQILNISDKYRYNLILQILLMVLAVGLNFILIPTLGLNGAALATAISIIVYNVLKTVLIYRWYRIHPFSWGLLKSIVFFVLVGVILSVIPIGHIYLGAAIKTGLFLVAGLLFILYGGASEDLKGEVIRIFKKYLNYERD
ncbi:MAG: polysaccharide biosynthesis C-terminal domain-containing protein [Bacteroidota bacterium]